MEGRKIKKLLSVYSNAVAESRYQNVKHINLEFARDIGDKHLEIVKSKCGHSIKNLEILNLNGCQKISDTGIEFIICSCPKLEVFSIYWNVRCVKLTDRGLQMILLKCSLLKSLNLYALSSLFGIVGVTDKSLEALSSTCSNTITTLDVNETKPQSTASAVPETEMLQSS
ncbi:F-box protein at3g58530 [Phtheirospermum japonicum]|uniref:F-box protein at3g58530 n=1 Tax=Phtheirospermum japonicum TaxID=374723 RepID=A0A830AZY3_9LAMI|nr:F-box protein at3g58530 [Phtheirospermum japonicum]